MLQLFAGIPLEIGAGAARMLTSCNSTQPITFTAASSVFFFMVVYIF